MKNKRKIIISLTVLIVICICGTVAYIILFKHDNSTNKNGRKVVASAKKQNITPSDTVSNDTTAATSVNTSTPTDSNNQSVTPINSNYKEFFKDSVFMGDSISEGLSYFDFIDEDKVVAGKGIGIVQAISEADKVIALNPKNIFILFGVNDSDDRTSSEWVASQYAQLVEKLKTNLPYSNIYVQGILPVLENMVNNLHINNKHINECNSCIQEMTESEKVNYVNIGSILNDSNKELYEGDGIHFKSGFYNLWLNYLENYQSGNVSH